MSLQVFEELEEAIEKKTRVKKENNGYYIEVFYGGRKVTTGPYLNEIFVAEALRNYGKVRVTLDKLSEMLKETFSNEKGFEVNTDGRGVSIDFRGIEVLRIEPVGYGELIKVVGLNGEEYYLVPSYGSIHSIKHLAHEFAKHLTF